MAIKEEVKGKRYLVTVWGNLRPDGSRPRMVRRVHGGPRAAGEMERSLIRLRDEGKDFTPQTVAQYAERFLAGKRREGKASRTLRHYRQSFAHLVPALGKKAVAKVTSGDLRDFFGALAGGTLSGTTRNGIERDVKALFRQAYHDKASHDDIGRSVAKTPTDGGEPVALSADEAAAFLASIVGTPVHLPALVMYCTGIRPEEMRGLCWDSLDLDAGVLKVVGRAVSVGQREVLSTDLKTTRSRRALRLDSGLCTLLEAHRAAIGLLRSERGPHWADMDLVFPSLRCHNDEYEAGRIWTATAFGHAWVKARSRDWRHVSPYTMRHTFITQRLMEGVRLEVVSRLAGHGTSATTAKHYSHVLEDELHGVVVALPQEKGPPPPE